MDESGPHRASPLPDSSAAPDQDPEWAEYVAWLDRQTAAGRDSVPATRATEAWAPQAPDPDDPDPDDPDPDNLEPYDPEPAFAHGGEADLLPPGPVLAQLTEQAVLGLGRLSDDELIGVLHATRRQVAREEYKQVLVTAEFGRRRQAAFEGAAARGVPAGCRPGGFPGEELAVELATTRIEAGHRIDDALDLTTRLPRTLAGMAAGLVDADRAGWIALYTRSLTPADAAHADEVLAAAAPDLRADQLARKAAALEMKLAPEAVKARREHARQTGQRVEARREVSGNASLAGRELDTADVMASKAYIDALAVRLRNSGLVEGTLDQLRALVMTDLTQGRDPLDRIAPAPSDSAWPSPVSADGPSDPSPVSPNGPSGLSPVPAAGPSAASSAAGSNGQPDQDPNSLASLGFHQRPAGEQDDRSRPGAPVPLPARPGAPVPLPALVNLLIPAGTLLGWSAAPGQAGTWGLLDAGETRAVVTAAAGHPRTRWCVTLTSPDGTALAHGCARGQHPGLLNGLAPQPPPQQLAGLLRRLGLTLTPIAQDPCDHASAEDGYVPSRALRHLVRARTATCDAPGCQAQAVNADIDHTVPWPDGPTDQCNLAPRCRTHHRAKQAPDWKVGQSAPGVTIWTLPSGRTHVTAPTTYDT